MNMLSVEIGRRIRNYRVNQKLSQEELAEKCGMHPTYIGQIERGEKNATIESISKISTGLSVSLSVLFDKLDSFEECQENYPLIAYNIVQSVPESVQKRIVSILETVVDIKNMH